LQRERLSARRLAAPVLVFLAVFAAPAFAEPAWVKDEVRVSLRAGAGSNFRITGALETGDRVEILSRGDGWTQVRPEGREAGWIPAGFLQEDPPARIALQSLQADKERLEQRVAELEGSSAQRESDHAKALDRDAAQRAEIERLTQENLRLRSGARWSEHLTGAGIVLVGMAIGALVARRSGRSRQQRIKL
jgi:SH3 domain protein